EIASSAERALPNDVVGAHGMDEHEDAELFRLRPERIELRQRRTLARDVARDAHTAQAEPFDGFLELLRREIRMLQRHGRQSGEAIRVRTTPLGELLVLNRDELPRGVAAHAVPPAALMAEDLYVDAEVVERLDSLRTEYERPVERVRDVAGEVGVFHHGDL